jgi:hypothetical protein
MIIRLNEALRLPIPMTNMRRHRTPNPLVKNSADRDWIAYIRASLALMTLIAASR